MVAISAGPESVTVHEAPCAMSESDEVPLVDVVAAPSQLSDSVKSDEL